VSCLDLLGARLEDEVEGRLRRPMDVREAAAFDHFGEALLSGLGT